MDTGRRILLSGITTLILVSQVIQLLTYEEKLYLVGGVVGTFILSYIFIDDILSLLKLNKR